MSLEKIPRSSLVEAVVTQLRAPIAAGEWPVGERIPVETELARRFGVGRNTVREAVRVLVHAGVLNRRQGAGTYVCRADDAQDMIRSVERAGLRDRIEMRLLLEAEGARLAAERATPADCRAIGAALAARRDWHAENAAGAEIDRFVAIDAGFHDAVVAASHNSALIDIYRYFAVATRQIIHLTETEADLPAPSQAAHAAVHDAIVAGDAEAAEAAIRALLTPMLDALTDTHIAAASS